MIETKFMDQQLTLIKEIQQLQDCWNIMMPLSFLQFIAYLEHTLQFLYSWAITFKFSIIITFCLIKTENRTKMSLSILPKNAHFLANPGTIW